MPDSEHDDEFDSPTKPRPVLADVSTFVDVERYDADSVVTVRPLSNPPDRPVAEVVVAAEWGETGVALTATEARTFARALLEVAARRRPRNAPDEGADRQ